jgi:tyrosinase
MPSPKRLLTLLWAATAALSVAAQEPVVTEEDFSQPEIDSGDALAMLNQLAADSSQETALRMAKKRLGGSCSPSQIKIRREWRTLTVNQRKQYISAVKCLQSAPSLFDPAQVPAARSLFDDFVAVHLFQTGNIHLTGTFLTWHRYFVHTYEEKLRTVCNYNGPLPYWEWGLDVNNPAQSPVFDGSATSLSGNGAFIPHEGIQMVQLVNGNILHLPPGTGSGCVTSGPFKDMKVNFGTIILPVYGQPILNGSANPLAWPDNERCLKRDINAGIAKRYTTFLNTTSLILKYKNIELFQAHLQGDDRYIINELGVHGGGHYTIGGDPGGDPFISPGDPAFYLHHAQVDRVYWIWQMLDFAKRQGVHGTHTLQNNPPSADVNVEDIIDISPLAPPVKIKDLMNTVGGNPLCYIYL